MYSIGDKIVYSSLGVCVVSAIDEHEDPLTGQPRMYYTLTPLFQQSTTVYTPVDNTRVRMRPIVSRRQALELIDRIPELRTPQFATRDVKELIPQYEATLKRQDCGDLIELTMALYAKRQVAQEMKRKLGAVDAHFLREAENNLFGELSVALEIPREQVEGFILQRLAENAAAQG